MGWSRTRCAVLLRGGRVCVLRCGCGVRPRARCAVRRGVRPRALCSAAAAEVGVGRLLLVLQH
eukprot:673152-Prymnesium_polylepis.1